MTVMIDAPRHAPFSWGGQLYVRSPNPIVFPSEGGPEEDVPESKRHLKARTTLYLILEEAFSKTAAIGSDQFVYWDANDPGKRLAPDAFVKMGRPDDPFDTWKVWERGAPDLAVEIVSPSDRPESDWAEKMERYRASGINELVRFDPSLDTAVRIWDRVNGDLVERFDRSPQLLKCATLGLYWIVVPAPQGRMLRLARDNAGKVLLPTPHEDKVQLAEELAEERRARAEAEHARILAEHERTAAERARDIEAAGRMSEAAAREAEVAAREAAEAALRVAEEKARMATEQARKTEEEVERLRAEIARLLKKKPG